MKHVLRFDNAPDIEFLKESISGDAKPSLIVIGNGMLGHLLAVQIANLLKDADIPLIVGDVQDKSDDALFKLLNDASQEERSVGTDIQRNIAALKGQSKFVIEALPVVDLLDVKLIRSEERKSQKSQDKNRQRHFNRNQKLPKGKK